MKTEEIRRRSERLVAEGNVQGAGALLADALKLQPYDTNLLIAKANVMLAGRQFGQAIDTLRELLDRKPDRADAWFLLGNAYRATRLPGDAIRCYETTLRLAPGFPGAWHFLGLARQTLGDLAGAEEAYEAACAERPEWPLLRWRLGSVQHLRGRLEAAVASYQQALRRDPKHHASLSNLAQALIELKRDDEAIEIARENLAHAPGHGMALANLLHAALGAGRNDLVDSLLDHERFIRQSALADAQVSGQAIALMTLPLVTGDAAGDFVTREFGAGDHPSLAPAVEAITTAVKEHLDALRDQRDSLANHPWAGRLPDQWQLRFWGEAHGPSKEEPTHCHPRAFLSGLCHLQVPSAEGTEEARLRFNEGDEAFLHRRPETLLELPLRVGGIVTYPGYYFHRTLPAAPEGERRLRLAFDVLPVRA